MEVTLSSPSFSFPSSLPSPLCLSSLLPPLKQYNRKCNLWQHGCIILDPVEWLPHISGNPNLFFISSFHFIISLFHYITIISLYHYNIHIFLICFYLLFVNFAYQLAVPSSTSFTLQNMNGTETTNLKPSAGLLYPSEHFLLISFLVCICLSIFLFLKFLYIYVFNICCIVI